MPTIPSVTRHKIFLFTKNVRRRGKFSNSSKGNYTTAVRLIHHPYTRRWYVLPLLHTAVVRSLCREFTCRVAYKATAYYT